GGEGVGRVGRGASGGGRGRVGRGAGRGGVGRGPSGGGRGAGQGPCVVVRRGEADRRAQAAHARHALEIGQEVIDPSARAAVEREVPEAQVQAVAQGQAGVGIILADGKAQNGQVRRKGDV